MSNRIKAVLALSMMLAPMALMSMGCSTLMMEAPSMDMAVAPSPGGYAGAVGGFGGGAYGQPAGGARRVTSKQTLDMAFGGDEVGQVVAHDAGAYDITTAIPLAQQRVLIRSARQEVVVKDIEPLIEQIKEIIEESGGYVENSSLGNEKRATFALRVPAERLEELMDEFGALGKEKLRRASADDVTDQLSDMEAVLQNDKSFRDRLRTLLDRAQNVEDVLQVERELVRLQSKIDSLEGRLRNLRGRVQLAQLDLRFERKEILGPVGALFWGLEWFGEKLWVLK